MGTLICIGDTEAGRKNLNVGECHLWTSDAHCLYFFAVASKRDPLPIPPRRVVIDLGLPKGGTGPLAGEFDPEVLILTHSDKDHIGGACTFFESLSSSPRLREVWVPYEWGLLADSLVDQWCATRRNSHQVGLDDRVTPDDIERAATEATDSAILGAAHQAGANLDQAPGDSEHRNSTWNELLLLLRSDSQLQAEIEGAVEQAIRERREMRKKWPLVVEVGKEGKVAKDVVRKATQITEILCHAGKIGAKVRYFSVDGVTGNPKPWLESGIPGAATVVNAIEVTDTISNMLDPGMCTLLLQQLTVQNRRALMPLLWSKNRLNSCKPWGALITSDSSGESAWVKEGYATSLVPWDHIAVMTAPHHGSAAVAHNDIWNAREEYQKDQGRVIPVVLAGGSGATKVPMQAYTDIAQRLRGCTRCRHANPTTRGNTMALDRKGIRKNAAIRKQIPQNRNVVVIIDETDVTISPHCIALP